MYQFSLIAAADDGVRSAKNVTVTTWKQEIAAAKKSIREVIILCFMFLHFNFLH